MGLMTERCSQVFPRGSGDPVLVGTEKPLQGAVVRWRAQAVGSRLASIGRAATRAAVIEGRVQAVPLNLSGTRKLHLSFSATTTARSGAGLVALGLGASTTKLSSSMLGAPLITGSFGILSAGSYHGGFSTAPPSSA